MNKKVMVIGHRGAMGHETENTIAAIQKALDLDADMIEVDVFRIKSGEIVVYHDEDVERLTNGFGKIEAYTWTELQKLTLIGNHKIPLLVDVINTIDAKVALNIELKGANTAKDVNEIMHSFIGKGKWSLDDFVISSFNWDELRKMRILNKNVAIGVLTEEDPIDAIPFAKEVKAISINPDVEKLTPENALLIKNAGLLIYVWTINEQKEMLKMKRMGVDAVFTNFPEKVF